MIIELLADAVAFWMRFWVYAFVGIVVGFGIIMGICYIHDIPLIIARRIKAYKKKGVSK